MRSFVARLSFERSDPSLQIFEGLPSEANSPSYFRRAAAGGIDQRTKINKAVHCLVFNREGIRLGKEGEGSHSVTWSSPS